MCPNKHGECQKPYNDFENVCKQCPLGGVFFFLIYALASGSNQNWDEKRVVFGECGSIIDDKQYCNTEYRGLISVSSLTFIKSDPQNILFHNTD